MFTRVITIGSVKKEVQPRRVVSMQTKFESQSNEKGKIVLTSKNRFRVELIHPFFHYILFSMSSLNQQLLGEMNGILLQAMQTLNEKLMSHSPEPIATVTTTPTPSTPTPAVVVEVGKKRKNDGGEEKKKKKTGPKSDSPWICFVKARSAEVKLQPGEKLMSILGAEWKALEEAEKEPFVAAAAAAAAALPK